MSETTSLVGKTIASVNREEVPDLAWGGTHPATVLTFTDNTTYTIVHATSDDWS